MGAMRWLFNSLLSPDSPNFVASFVVSAPDEYEQFDKAQNKARDKDILIPVPTAHCSLPTDHCHLTPASRLLTPEKLNAQQPTPNNQPRSKFGMQAHPREEFPTWALGVVRWLLVVRFIPSSFILQPSAFSLLPYPYSPPSTTPPPVFTP